MLRNSPKCRHSLCCWAALHCASCMWCVSQIEGLWRSFIEQVYWRHFSNSICSLCVFGSHVGNAHNISTFFIITMFIMVISDLWCYYYNSLKIQMMATSFCSSVAKSCPRLCDPVDCSTPGLPVHHQLPKFTQTHVHPVGDAIQPSHLLSSPSPAFNLSQHQGLFQ